MCLEMESGLSSAAPVTSASVDAPHQKAWSHDVPPASTPAAQMHIEEFADHILVCLPMPAYHIPTPLSLLCISDTHDLHEDMPSCLPKADILVHAGDFTNVGGRDEVENFGRWTQQLLDDGVVHDVVFVAGNHDLNMPLTAKRPEVREAQERMKQELVDRPHVHYLEDTGCEVRGLHFWGTPWTTLFGRDWAFQLKDMEDPQYGLDGKFSAIPVSRCDVLVSHQPPLGQGDNTSACHGVGSRTLLNRVLQANPLLHVFGHVHSGHGVSTRDGCRTIFVNAAVCDEDVRPTQKPILVVLQPCAAAH